MTQPLARFELPLTCAPTLNKYSRMHWAQRRNLKAYTYTRMLAQAGRRASPLPGRPRVQITRLSAREADRDGLWGSVKLVLDCLKADKQGLGWIRDDSPQCVNVLTGWRKVAAGKGSVVVEIWSDES